MPAKGNSLACRSQPLQAHNVDYEECCAHIALMEFAMGASAESLSDKYGFDRHELEKLTLQTSAMPILDGGVLGVLEQVLLGRVGTARGNSQPIEPRDH